MTDAQLAVLAKADTLANYKKYIDLAREAEATVVHLPHTNERGEPVVAGCNNAVRNLAQNYRLIADRFYTLLTSTEDVAEARRYEIEKS